jgi:hypothetical protein
MEGGLFGLSKGQQTYLYICQLVPTLIAISVTDLTFIMLLVEVFYILSSYVYVKFMSI